MPAMFIQNLYFNVLLRKLVLNRQDWLMRSTHISPIGDPDYENIEEWEAILRQDFNFKFLCIFISF
jgi:hypothetical protein